MVVVLVEDVVLEVLLVWGALVVVVKTGTVDVLVIDVVGIVVVVKIVVVVEDEAAYIISRLGGSSAST